MALYLGSQDSSIEKLGRLHHSKWALKTWYKSTGVYIVTIIEPNLTVSSRNLNSHHTFRVISIWHQISHN
jgi:hypothetical protein